MTALLRIGLGGLLAGALMVALGAVNMTEDAQNPERTWMAEGNKRFARPIRNTGLWIFGAGLAITFAGLVLA